MRLGGQEEGTWNIEGRETTRREVVKDIYSVSRQDNTLYYTSEESGVLAGALGVE
jgi:hypothetical protein